MNQVLSMKSEFASGKGEVTSIYYPWFDWLRAICACTVMLYHDQVLSWHHAGGFAVQVFFALSGWLIGGILLKTEPDKLFKFYFNRAIRIWIPYYFAAILLLAISVFRDPLTSKWVEIVIYKITFVYNLFGTQQLAEFKSAMPQGGVLNHFWSVNAEEQFYLVAPVLLVLGAKYFGRSVCLWILISIAAFVCDIYAAIVLGVLAAIVVDKLGNIHLTGRGRAITLAVVLLGSYCLARDIYYELLAPIVGLGIVVLLAVPARQHKFGAIFGGMSYPLYLNHWIGVYAFNFLLPGMRDDPIRQFLSAIGNVVFAMALYWFIDRRLLAHRAAWYTPVSGLWVTYFAYGIVFIGITYGLLWPYAGQF